MQYFTIFSWFFLLFSQLIMCDDKVPTFEVAKGHFGGFSADIQGNFFYAFQYCKSIFKNVPTPNTKEKNDAFIQFLTENKIERTWTSGNDLSEEGTFLWMTDGSKVTYTKWHGDNPDNYYDNHQTENCIELLLKSDGIYYWNDAFCTNKYSIVCEGEKVNPSSKQLPHAIKCADL